jgi:hypothetical protein
MTCRYLSREAHMRNSLAVKVATAACTTGSDAQGLDCIVTYDTFWKPDAGELGGSQLEALGLLKELARGGKTR